ncbi:MAG: hypothetical protein ABI307_01075 [Mycobacterium sp.]
MTGILAAGLLAVVSTYDDSTPGSVSAVLTWAMYARPRSTAVATPESDEMSGSDEPDTVMSQLVQRDER